jgi:hypothetical protein
MLDTITSGTSTLETGNPVHPTEVGVPSRVDPFDGVAVAKMVAGLRGRLAFEVIMLPAAVALFSVGLYVATRAYQRPAAAFREMLTAAAAPERTGELPLSVEPGASNVR